MVLNCFIVCISRNFYDIIDSFEKYVVKERLLLNINHVIAIFDVYDIDYDTSTWFIQKDMTYVYSSLPLGSADYFICNI